MVTKGCLVAIGKPSHTRHDTENVVVGGIDTNLGGLGALNSGVGENKLKGGIVNTGEIARARRLVFLWSESKGIHVNSLIGVSGMGLVRLNP